MCVRTTGRYEDVLLIHDNTSLCYPPNDANILAYIGLDNCVVMGSPHVYDDSVSRVMSQDTSQISSAIRLYQTAGSTSHNSILSTTACDWACLFGNTADPLLTPRTAAHIYDTLMYNAEESMIYLNWKKGRQVPDLPQEAEPFFIRSLEWRNDFTACYMRIGLRLQKGIRPRPNCYGENISFHNFMKEILVDQDEQHSDNNDDDNPYIMVLPKLQARMR